METRIQIPSTSGSSGISISQATSSVTPTTQSTSARITSTTHTLAITIRMDLCLEHGFAIHFQSSTAEGKKFIATNPDFIREQINSRLFPAFMEQYSKQVSTLQPSVGKISHSDTISFQYETVTYRPLSSTSSPATFSASARAAATTTDQKTFVETKATASTDKHNTPSSRGRCVIL